MQPRNIYFFLNKENENDIYNIVDEGKNIIKNYMIIIKKNSKYIYIFIFAFYKERKNG